jgi:hypothetical protein
VAAAFAAANTFLPVHGTGYILQFVEFHVLVSSLAPQRRTCDAETRIRF